MSRGVCHMIGAVQLELAALNELASMAPFLAIRVYSAFIFVFAKHVT